MALTLEVSGQWGREMGWLQDLLSEVPLSVVLRERVQLAEERYEKALQDVEAYKKRINELEAENGTLRAAQVPSLPSSSFDEETTRVLVHMFKTERHDLRDVGVMARALGLERSLMQYHLDRLRDAKLADSAGGNYVLKHIYWVLTSEGRRYVVERGLAK